MQNQSTKQSFMLGRAHKIMCSDSNCKMQNEILKFKIFRYEKETAEKFTEIYSQREGEDSSGGFGLERTKETDSGILSKNF